MLDVLHNWRDFAVFLASASTDDNTQTLSSSSSLSSSEPKQANGHAVLRSFTSSSSLSDPT
jgi:hypothetical protein